MVHARCFIAWFLAGALRAPSVWAEPHPVAAVVDILKDMLTTLEADQHEDEEVYDKMECWCETNDKQKTQAISDAEAHMKYLDSESKSLAAKSAKLSAEITALTTQVSADQAALDQATNIREQQSKAFAAEEQDLNESIVALTGAIAVLSKHHSTLLQEPPARMLSLATMLQEQVRRHQKLLKGVLTPSQRRFLKVFMQVNLGRQPGFLNASPGYKNSYESQSGEVYGILQEMLEAFQRNLADAQNEEAAAKKQYDELSAAKGAEIQACSDSISTKSGELADVNLKKAEADQDFKDTADSLSADEQYLRELKQSCSLTDKEWEERQKTRQDEMTAVSKAIAVLSNSDAQDTFHRTFSPTFMQLGSTTDVEVRSKVVGLLFNVSKNVHDPKMSSLAMHVKLDNFTEVKEMIDKMVENLLQEKEDETKVKAYCESEIDENERRTTEKEGEKATALAEIAKLETEIDTLTGDIKTLGEEVDAMHLDLKRAGEDRAAENRDFQTTVADQRKTQSLLEKAKDALKSYYAQSFLQKAAKQAPVGPPPPSGFEAYANNPSAASAIGIIETILIDAKKLEEDAVTAEASSQQAYEDEVKRMNDDIETKAKTIVDKTAAKTRAEAALVDEEVDRDSISKDLELLSDEASNMHAQCDFTLKNFEVRQTARDEEVAALNRAKNILSGLE